MSEERKNIKVLVVDDEPTLRRICVNILTQSGYEAVAVEDAESALKEAQSQTFDLVLTDIMMPGMRGDVLIDHLREIQPELMAVVMTGHPSMELAIDSVRKGVREFITKPFKLKGLRSAVQNVVEQRAAEEQRTQRQFAAALLEMEQRLGDEFDLHQALETLIHPEVREREGEAETEKASPAAPPEATPSHPQETPGEDQSIPSTVVLCESIPRDVDVIKASEEYHHFRTIYAAQKVLNEQLKTSSHPVEVKLATVSHSAEIPRRFRRLGEQLCCIIFGPNLSRLGEATVRMMANADKDRYVVVCHNPDQAGFSWDQLTDLSQRMSIRGCRASADKKETRAFWAKFFTRDLKSLIEKKASRKPEEREAGSSLLSTEEIRTLLARDHAAMELLPAFPHICQQVIQAIDAGQSYAEVARIIHLDGALQASIIRTANLARYGAQQRIEALPLALSMIGMEETKKIILGKAMSELMRKVDQAGFNTRDFFQHSTGAGYLAQILSVNIETPSPKEQEILQSLRLPKYVLEVLKAFRCWERFNIGATFDSFTAGLLHDVGQLVNTVCYKDIFPLILYEIERSQWRGSLLGSERAVVGDFQHPVTGGALLEQWEIFPALVEPIRTHHQLPSSGASEAVLIALANCLVKGQYPFPRMISIPDEYRKTHLKPVADEEFLSNPLPGVYQPLAETFAALKSELEISPPEMESGEYRPETVDGLIRAAREAARQDAATFMHTLVDQNPEFLDVVEQIQVPAEELFALSLLLEDAITERVNGFFQGSRLKKST